MMNRLWIVAMAAALGACSRDPLATEQAGMDGRTVQLMAEAPDGTKLWRFDAGVRYVYFSSAGTSTTVSCGKNCRREEQVPAAVPLTQ